MRLRAASSAACLLVAMFAPLPANCTDMVDWSGPAYYVKTAFWDAQNSSSYDALEAGPFSSQSECDTWMTSHYDEVEQLVRSCQYFASNPYKS